MILRTAYRERPDERLPQVLAMLRADWIACVRRKRLDVGTELDDALQNASLKVIAPENLATLDDPERLIAWARAIFVNSLHDLGRSSRRLWRGRVVTQHDDQEALGRIPSLDPSPEEIVSAREREETVRRIVERVPMARLRLLEGLSEKEIAERLGVTRDAVAGQTKRLRKLLWRVLEGDE